jgi:hypothetical protein
MKDHKPYDSANFELTSHPITSVRKSKFMQTSAAPFLRQPLLSAVYELLNEDMRLVYVFIFLPAHSKKSVLTCHEIAALAKSSLGESYHETVVNPKTAKLLESKQFIALYQAIHDSAGVCSGQSLKQLLANLEEHYDLIFDEKRRDYALGIVLRVSPRTIRNIRAGVSQ